MHSANLIRISYLFLLAARHVSYKNKFLELSNTFNEIQESNEEIKEILKNPNWSQEQREELKVKYSEAVELTNGFKKELSTLCKKDRFCSQIITEFLNQV